MWQPVVFLSVAFETSDTSALIIMFRIQIMNTANVKLFNSVLIIFEVADLVDKRALRWKITVSPDVS